MGSDGFQRPARARRFSSAIATIRRWLSVVVWGRLGQNLVAEGRDGEIAADAAGGSGIVQEDHPLAGNAHLALQSGDQFGEAAELHGGRHRVIEVADEADADAGGFDVGDAGWRGGGLLLVPARADLDLAVLAPLAVSNDEVIGHIAAGGGQRFCVAGDGAAVVNVNVPPLIGASGGGGLEDVIEELFVIAGGKRIERFAGQRRGRQGEKQSAGESEKSN
jgi:hypothetical protein